MGAAILFALALSFDGFGVGLSYGLRRIRIPLPSMFVITLCTVLSMGISVVFGDSLMRWLTFVSPKVLAAGILLGLGTFQVLRAIIHVIKAKGIRKAVQAGSLALEEPIIKLEFKVLGVIIQVLKAPEQADLDGSGTISLKESLLLGTALSLDAFASGLALGLAVGFLNSLSAIGLVALTQFAMIRLGQNLTGKIPEEYLDRLELLPGTMLILLALGKLI